MKKDRWCGEFNLGKCQISVNEPLLSLAIKETEIVKVEPEKIELTDRNSILNFLAFEGFKENLRSGKIPSSVTITIPRSETREYLKCTASNCRSKQKMCNHFT